MSAQHTHARIAGYDVTVRLELDDSGRVQNVDMALGTAPGGSLSLLVDCITRAVNVGLAAGVPVASFVHPLRGQTFRPNGSTGNPDVPECSSLVDFLARVMERAALAGGAA